jgi:hypothetical protein
MTARILRCSLCNRLPTEYNLSMFPIEPKSTPDRKWACLDCLKQLPDSEVKGYVQSSKMYYNEVDPTTPITFEEWSRREEKLHEIESFS